MDEQEMNKRLEIVKSLKGIIPSNFGIDALRKEIKVKIGLL